LQKFQCNRFLQRLLGQDAGYSAGRSTATTFILRPQAMALPVSSELGASAMQVPTVGGAMIDAIAMPQLGRKHVPGGALVGSHQEILFGPALNTKIVERPVRLTPSALP
jgi:hypothetical protein